MEKIKSIECFKRKYVIPCFQREYSWGEEEIETLIKNISLLKDDDEYCIGVVTTQNNDNNLLLIDGQQRITTLYLLAIYTGLIVNKEDINLKSEYEELVSGENNLINVLLDNFEKLSESFINGLRYIKNNINEDEKEKYKDIISRLYYYEIDLDKNINLNYYFEVMNSRGVQLSRSDIVKSYLMNKLSEDNQFRLNQLWYKYEKMDSKYSFNTFDQISKKMKSNYKTINEILKLNANISKKKEKDSNVDSDTSILNFEYFLLYVIRLYNNRTNDDLRIIGEFNLEDLIKEYEDTFKNVNNEEDIIKFLNYMIKMKNIYDKCIVKYNSSTEDWSLGINNKNTKLIQSCLRVSFVNRRLMHWIYMTLKYFYSSDNITKYNLEMRNYIRDNYLKDFLKFAENDKVDYKTGFDTPIIVLNYLDLLIKENYNQIVKCIPEACDLKIKEFKFKFRNSIEHFKPRHGQGDVSWVDDFGNLALLAYGTNIKIQNAEPDIKAEYFKKDLYGYSLKLQIMAKIGIQNKWDENSSYKLRDIFIKLIKNDLNAS